SWELHRTGVPAEAAPLPPPAVQTPHLRALVEHVGDVEAAARVERHPERLVEAASDRSHAPQRIEVGGRPRKRDPATLEGELVRVAHDDDAPIHEHARRCAEPAGSGSGGSDHRDEPSVVRHVLDPTPTGLGDPETTCAVAREVPGTVELALAVAPGTE